MPRFQDVLKNVHSLVRGEKNAEELAEFFKADPRRLNIYPSFVKGHVTKFLDQNFISLKTLFDEAIWGPLCDEYFKKHPPSDWRLYKCAESFTDFLQGLMGDDRYGIEDFHVELALFEWMEVCVYKSEIVFPDPQEVTQATVNPTLQIMNFTYPIAQFVTLSRSKELKDEEKSWMEDKEYLKSKENVALFFRHPFTHAANYYSGEDRFLFALKIVYEKMGMEEAAQVSGHTISDIHSVFEEARNRGLIFLPR
jgi:hypothetical protein